MQDKSQEELKAEARNEENTGVSEEETEATEIQEEDVAEFENGTEGDQDSDQLKELEAQVQEKENRYLRLLADFDNYRRRVKVEKEADEKYRAQQLITNLLPAIDNLERAMDITPENEQTEALLEGVQMVYRNIVDALKTEGAEQIEAAGNEFDPNLHQAVMQAEEEGAAENIVLEEFQKGYRLKDRVIRPSMVKVSK